MSEINRAEFEKLKEDQIRMAGALKLVDDRSKRNERRINKANEERGQERSEFYAKLDALSDTVRAECSGTRKQLTAHNNEMTQKIAALQISEAKREGQGMGKRELFFLAVAAAGLLANLIQAWVNATP